MLFLCLFDDFDGLVLLPWLEPESESDLEVLEVRLSFLRRLSLDDF